MRAPFPWFGGKSRVADLVWELFSELLGVDEDPEGSLHCLPCDVKMEDEQIIAIHVAAGHKMEVR